MAVDLKRTTPVFLGATRSGLRNVGSYQVSGAPFITGSSVLGDDEQQKVSFPYVTKSVTVINTNDTGEIRVHFQSGSTAAVPIAGLSVNISDDDSVIADFHYITVPAGNSAVTFDVKCKEIFVSQTSVAGDLAYQVFAELTGIPTQSMYHLTGSGITE